MRSLQAILVLWLAVALGASAVSCNTGKRAAASQGATPPPPFTGTIENRVRVIRAVVRPTGFEPAAIAVLQGEQVRLELTSQEGVCIFQIEAFGISQEVPAGQTAVITFRSQEPGKFPFKCTPSGAGQVETTGQLIVRQRDFVRRALSHYGLVALFGLLMLGIAGIPMPDELMLSFAGYLAHAGNYNMNYASTVIVAFLGASCGITFSYFLGRTVGLGVVHKWGKWLHVTPERLNRVHEWYVHKKGRWALMFCIFAPVFRHLTAIVAGTSKMPFWEFGLYAYSGVLMWVCTFVTLGFYFGRVWARMSTRVHGMLLIASALLGLGMLIWVIRKNRAEHRKAIAAAGDQTPQGPADGHPRNP